MRKNAEIITDVKKSVEDRDMELINRYTRRKMTADEVYTFSVVLCDNEIDRDFERFSKDALFALKELFLGKTGVFDHNPKAENQTARIYDLDVEKVSGTKTTAGDDYYRLVAKAYLPRCAKTEDLILMLDSGIQKEVSVGCAVSRSKCSVCGKENGVCAHVKGKTYDGKLCYHELSEPYDAYEWSFVAVPAQRGAGVIKTYNSLDNIVKSVKSGLAVSLNAEQAALLAGHIAELEEQAQDGARYKSELLSEVKRLSAFCGPNVSAEISESVLGKMTVKELRAYRDAYAAQKKPLLPVSPQLATKGGLSADQDNHTFMI